MKFVVPQEANPRSPVSGWRVALSLFVILVLDLVLAAVTAVVLMWFLLPHLPPAWSDAVTHRGQGKIMVRAMQVWLVVLLPLILRFSGWYGWRDCGWQRDTSATTTPRLVWQDLFKGAVVGLISLGGLAVFMLATNRRWLCVLDTDTSLLVVLLGFAMSAAVVAVFEETLARGIIFRLWARAWGAVVAAVISSLLFAISHFLEPAPAAFAAPTFGCAVWTLILSTLHPAITGTAGFVQFLNLACLGAVLCAMVRLTGNIWLAVGAHAGWVWSIKVNNFFTDALPIPLRDRIWGARGDLTDSMVGTLALLAVLMSVLLLQRRSMWHTGEVRLRRGSFYAAVGGLSALAIAAISVVHCCAVPLRWGVVEKGVIFRSGQLAPSVAWKLLRMHHIFAVVDLGNQTGFQHDVELWICRHLGIKHVALPLAPDGTGAVASYVDALDILASARREGDKSVLVHCLTGREATGGVVAAFRLLIEGAAPKTVRAEMEQYGWRAANNPALLPFLEKNLPAMSRELKSRGIPVHDVPMPIRLETP